MYHVTNNISTHSAITQVLFQFDLQNKMFLGRRLLTFSILKVSHIEHIQMISFVWKIFPLIEFPTVKSSLIVAFAQSSGGRSFPSSNFFLLQDST